MLYENLNDSYFTKHFEKLIKKHGGEWIVIAKGEKIGIVPKYKVKDLLEIARDKFPNEICLISPIPKEEEIECIL